MTSKKEEIIANYPRVQEFLSESQLNLPWVDLLVHSILRKDLCDELERYMESLDLNKRSLLYYEKVTEKVDALLTQQRREMEHLYTQEKEDFIFSYIIDYEKKYKDLVQDCKDYWHKEENKGLRENGKLKYAAKDIDFWDIPENFYFKRNMRALYLGLPYELEDKILERYVDYYYKLSMADNKN